MRAIWTDSPGEPEVMYIAEKDAPAMKPGHVRVDIRATALNRADLLQRRGLYPPPAGESDILGLEMAGVVVDSGDTQIANGSRVCALLPGGGYAEQVVVPQGMLMELPPTLSFAEGAAIPEVFLTAYSNLVWLGKLGEGQRVLIHAGASGVGTAAIQLVQAMKAHSIVTVGSDAKREACLSLGADEVIVYRTTRFVDAVQQWTHGTGVDVILDFIGAPYFADNLACLAVDGRLIIVGTMGGNQTDGLDLGLLLRKRLQVLGTALRSRPHQQKESLTQEFWQFAKPRFATGALRAVVDRVFSWHDVAAAHRYMEDNQNIGKIVLAID